ASPPAIVARGYALVSPSINASTSNVNGSASTIHALRLSTGTPAQRSQSAGRDVSRVQLGARELHVQDGERFLALYLAIRADDSLARAPNEHGGRAPSIRLCHERLEIFIGGAGEKEGQVGRRRGRTVAQANRRERFRPSRVVGDGRCRFHVHFSD